jgi:scyllo-inositol 2-dehydrogenase (NADP+)
MSIRVGLLGFGLAGRRLHAPIIAAAGLDIAAIATSRADEAGKDWPGAAIVASPEALCARADVDVVVVVTPDALHAAHARLALEAGKHVVVDKPITLASSQARALADLADARGLIASCYQNRRWDSDFLTLRELFADGALGDIKFYEARWDRWRAAPRNDWHDDSAYASGEIFGLGPHLIDQVLVLFGVPDWLTADIYAQRPGQSVSDGFQILMAKGATRISLGVNLMAADEAKFCRVLGDKAAYLKRGLDPQEPPLRALQPIGADFGVEPEAEWGRLTEAVTGAERTVRAERGAWISFYRGFAASIEQGSPNPVPAREAARVIGVIEAAVESAASGRRIDLPAFLAERGLAA